jgi:hypothetical protein
MVNNHSDASSADSGNSEDRGAPLAGDLYVGHFGDMIMCKKKTPSELDYKMWEDSLLIKEK